MNDVTSVVLDYTYILTPALAAIFVLGLFATLAPERFGQFAKFSSIWIDTNKIILTLDRRVDMDRSILSHGRVFGVIVMTLSATLVFLLYR